MSMMPQPSLPPGYRFHPTDEELVLHYLRRKVASVPLPVSIIAEVDIYKFDPWDLPPMAAFGEKEWYFFSPRDRKYPNGSRPNRAAASGYWKATGTDKVIVSPSCTSTQGRHINVGVKKALVFYKGRPPRGMKTNWIMHEYRLAESSNYRAVRVKDSPMRLDDWVLCRIYKKSYTANPAILSVAGAASIEKDQDEEYNLSVAGAASIEKDQDEEYNHRDYRQSTTLESSLKSDMISGHYNDSLVPQKSSSFSNLLDAMDYAMITNILSDTNQLSSPAGFPPILSSSLDNDNNYPNIYYQPQLIGSEDVGAGIFTMGNSGQKRQHSCLDTGTSWSSSMCQMKRLVGHQEIVPQQMNTFNFDNSLLKQQLLLNPNYCGSFPR